MRTDAWKQYIERNQDAIIVLEGVSMYFKSKELEGLLSDLTRHFNSVKLLVDCYTKKAAKASKYKNPINDVGVFEVFGLDEPQILNCDEFKFTQELEMTPQKYIDELAGLEKPCSESSMRAIQRRNYIDYMNIRNKTKAL